MFKALKISISLILSILILTTTFIADGVDANANQGGNTVDTGGTWLDVTHQGYRISVYENETQFKKAIDFTFSPPSAEIPYYTNKKGNSVTDAKTAPSGMPYAVVYSGGNLNSNGNAFENWFTENDAEKLKQLLTQQFNYSDEDLDAENENNKLDGMKVLVEPIFWFAQKNESGAKSPIIYGTITNINEWCMNNIGFFEVPNSRYSANGGLMAKLVGKVGAECLKLDNSELGIPEPPRDNGQFYTYNTVVSTGLGAHIYTPSTLLDDEPEEDEEPEETNLTLEQSQITKRVSTSNSDLFGEYRLKFELPALDPTDEHTYTETYNCSDEDCEDCPHEYIDYCPIDQVADNSLTFKFTGLKNTKNIEAGSHTSHSLFQSKFNPSSKSETVGNIFTDNEFEFNNENLENITVLYRYADELTLASYKNNDNTISSLIQRKANTPQSTRLSNGTTIESLSFKIGIDKNNSDIEVKSCCCGSCGSYGYEDAKILSV